MLDGSSAFSHSLDPKLTLQTAVYAEAGERVAMCLDKRDEGLRPFFYGAAAVLLALCGFGSILLAVHLHFRVLFAVGLVCFFVGLIGGFTSILYGWWRVIRTGKD